jgi:hypothetical protein
MTHITTTESLRAGLEDEPPVKCWLCGQETMRPSWCDLRCDTCGADGDELFWSLQTARRKARITRRDFAKAVGFKPHNVSNYECSIPSRRYFDACVRFFHKYYGEGND